MGGSAPPPEYKFALLPVVTGRDAFMRAKETGTAYQQPKDFSTSGCLETAQWE